MHRRHRGAEALPAHLLLQLLQQQLAAAALSIRLPARPAAPPRPAADYYSSKYNAYYSLQHAGGFYYIWGAQDWCDDLVTVAGTAVGRGQMVLVYYTDNAEQVEVEKAIFTNGSPAPSLSNRGGWVGARPGSRIPGSRTSLGPGMQAPAGVPGAALQAGGC